MPEVLRKRISRGLLVLHLPCDSASATFPSCCLTYPQNRRAQRDFQKFHVKKHEIVAQAKREEREAMKRERAALESRQGSTSVGSVSHSSINGSSDGKGDMIRRTPSSGTLLTRAFGGAGSGGARGKPAEGGVSEPPPKQAAQIRTTCFENNLNEFFQIS